MVADGLANQAEAFGGGPGPLLAVGRRAAPAYLNWHDHPGLLQTVYVRLGRPRSDHARGPFPEISPRNPLQDAHSHS